MKLALNHSGIVVKVLIQKFQFAFPGVYLIDQLLNRPFGSNCFFEKRSLENIYCNIVIFPILQAILHLGKVCSYKLGQIAFGMIGRNPKSVMKFKSKLTVFKICPLCNTIV